MARLGEYTLVSELGRGGFATVWLATDDEAQPHALKKYGTEHGSEVDTQKAQNERVCLERFDHPNVLSLRDVVVDESGVDSLVLEYCEGGDLIKRMQRRTAGTAADEAGAYLLWRQILEGCKHMHARGVSHLDLKPQNVLLSKDEPDNPSPLVKLCDFSHSYPATPDEPLVPPTQVGAGKYMAPEVSSGEPYDGYKADVWSCGAILYTLLCGALPFADAEKIMVGEWNRVPWFSPALSEVFSSCFTVNPTDRIGLEELSRCRWCADCAAASDVPLGDAAPADEPGVAALDVEAADASETQGAVAAAAAAGEVEAAVDRSAVKLGTAVGGDAGSDEAAGGEKDAPADAEERNGADYFGAGEADYFGAGEADEPNMSALSVVLEGDREEEAETRPPSHREGRTPPAKASGGGLTPTQLASGPAVTAPAAVGVDVYGVPTAVPPSLPAPAGAKGDAGGPEGAAAGRVEGLTSEGGAGFGDGEAEEHGLSYINGVVTSDAPTSAPAEPLPKQAGMEKPGRPGRSRPGAEQTKPSPTRLSRGRAGAAEGRAATRHHHAGASAAPPELPSPTPPATLSLDARLVSGHDDHEETSPSPSPDRGVRQRRGSSATRHSDTGAAAAASSYTARHAQRVSRTQQPPSPMRGGWTDHGDMPGAQPKPDSDDAHAAHAGGTGGSFPYRRSWAEAATARPEIVPPRSPPQTPPSLAALEAKQREISGLSNPTDDQRALRLSAEHAHHDYPAPDAPSSVASAPANADSSSPWLSPPDGSAGDFRQGFQQLNQLLGGSAAVGRHASGVAPRHSATRSVPNLVDCELGYGAGGSAASEEDDSLSAVVGLAMRAVESLGGVGYQLAPPPDRVLSLKGLEQQGGAVDPVPVATRHRASTRFEAQDARAASALQAPADAMPAASAPNLSTAAGSDKPPVYMPRVAPATKEKRGYSSAATREAAASERAVRQSEGWAGDAPIDKAGARQRVSPMQSDRAGSALKPGQANEGSTPARDAGRGRTLLPPASGSRSQGDHIALAAKPAPTPQQNLPKVASRAAAQPPKPVRTRRASGEGYAAPLETEAPTSEVGPARRRAPSPPRRRVGGAQTDPAPASSPTASGQPSVPPPPPGWARSPPVAPLSPMDQIRGAGPAQSMVGGPRSHGTHEPAPAMYPTHPARPDAAWGGMAWPQPAFGGMYTGGGYGMPMGMMPPLGMPPPGLHGLMPPHHGMLPPMPMLPPHLLQAMMMQHSMSPWGMPALPMPAALAAPAARLAPATKAKKEPVIRLLPQGGKAPAPAPLPAERHTATVPPHAVWPPPPYMGAPPFMPPFSFPGQLGYMHPPAGYPA